MGRLEKRGREKELLGQGKEIVGIITGDSALELEGYRLEAEGEAQQSLGKAIRKAAELVDEAAKAVKK